MPASLDLNKTAVDIGFVIRDSKATLDFYCGVLGLEHVMDMELPASPLGKAVMHRVQCGATTLKFQKRDNAPEASNPPGGPGGAVGLRYLTIWVTNLDTILSECRVAGHAVVLEPMVIRPGVRIAFVADPDGNWVELLESTPV
jgi:catechol 2,3-dioxygenase-like lactoylglutathione lyase family enzyme